MIISHQRKNEVDGRARAHLKEKRRFHFIDSIKLPTRSILFGIHVYCRFFFCIHCTALTDQRENGREIGQKNRMLSGAWVTMWISVFWCRKTGETKNEIHKFSTCTEPLNEWAEWVAIRRLCHFTDHNWSSTCIFNQTNNGVWSIVHDVYDETTCFLKIKWFSHFHPLASKSQQAIIVLFTSNPCKNHMTKTEMNIAWIQLPIWKLIFKLKNELISV